MHYKRAVMKKPAYSLAEGITTQNIGKPLYEKAMQQHRMYEAALKACGVTPVVLWETPEYPDSCFVEDTAVLTDTDAIISHPGHPNRRGEEKQLERLLNSEMCLWGKIQEPGTLDGGDVVRTEEHYCIGLSQRTNEEGALQLRSMLEKLGYRTTLISVPQNVLHLTTGSGYLGERTMLCIPEFAESYRRAGFKPMVVDDEERYAANVLLVNGTVLMPKGFPKTRQKIEALHERIIELEMSVFEKLDGGITCLSLRW